MPEFWNSGGVWTRKERLARMKWSTKYATGSILIGYVVITLLEQHIHNTDIINWIKGAYPIKANGHGGRQVRGNPANDPDWKDHGEIYDHHFGQV